MFIDKKELFEMGEINLEESIERLTKEMRYMEGIISKYEKRLEKIDTENEYLRSKLNVLISEECELDKA